MASILFLIETIQRNQFRCNYLENKIFFSEFFSKHLKSSLNVEHFQKQDGPRSWCISEYPESEKRGYINI